MGALKDGEIVCFPTETLYALACNAYSESSLRRLYDIKKRSYDRPLSLILRNASQMDEFTYMTGTDSKVVEMLSPGPITYVLPLRKTQNLPKVFFKNTLGVRIPDHKLAHEILTKVDFPVAATSANISGENAAVLASEITMEIRKNVSKFLEDDYSVSGICSTVFDMISRKVLREGMISSTKIIDAINVAEKQHGYNSGARCSKEYSSKEQECERMAFLREKRYR